MILCTVDNFIIYVVYIDDMDLIKCFIFKNLVRTCKQMCIPYLRKLEKEITRVLMFNEDCGGLFVYRFSYLISTTLAVDSMPPPYR